MLSDTIRIGVAQSYVRLAHGLVGLVNRKQIVDGTAWENGWNDLRLP
jgi:hypothetical protein